MTALTHCVNRLPQSPQSSEYKLLIAARDGRIDEITKLLDQEANIDATDDVRRVSDLFVSLCHCMFVVIVMNARIISNQ